MAPPEPPFLGGELHFGHLGEEAALGVKEEGEVLEEGSAAEPASGELLLVGRGEEGACEEVGAEGLCGLGHDLEEDAVGLPGPPPGEEGVQEEGLGGKPAFQVEEEGEAEELGEGGEPRSGGAA